MRLGPMMWCLLVRTKPLGDRAAVCRTSKHLKQWPAFPMAMGTSDTGVAILDIRLIAFVSSLNEAPIAPPGWFAANICGVSRPALVCRESAIARAKLSPRAKVIVVEVVGADIPNEAISLSCSVVGSRKFREDDRLGCVRIGQVLGLV